jgi:cytochrome c oxidase subunit 1
MWQGLTTISALGGVVLFASAGFFVLVMLGTLLAGKPIEPEPIVWAESLGTPAEGYRVTVWDRLGLWFAVAVVLVLIAYVVPIWDILHLTRYGSPGFKPF